MPALPRAWGHGALAMSCVIAVALVGGAALVDAAPAVRVDAALGLGGWIVPGRFVPLRLEVRASRAVRGTLEVEIPSSAGDRVVYAFAVQLPAEGRAQFTADVVIADPRRPVTVRLRGAPRLDLTVPVGSARAAEGIVAAVTEERAGLEFLATAGARMRPAYLDSTDLPVTAQGYEGVALLAVRDLDDGALLPAQRTAVLDWLAEGGRLLLVPGGRFPLPGWLSAVAPAQMGEAAVAAGSVPVPLVALRPLPGARVVQSGGAPLAVRTTVGQGLVEIWAFDPFAPPGRVWSGRMPLWRALLRPPSPASYGAALAEELPRTRPLPGSTQLGLAVLCVGYIAAVRRAFRRFGSTPALWVTLLLLAVAASAALYTAATGARRAAGSVAQLSVIDAFPGTRRGRALTYISLIAPYGGGVELTLPPGSAVRPLGPVGLRVQDGTVLTATPGRGGPGLLEVSQFVPLELRARAVARDGMVELTLAPGGPRLESALLYQGGQIYRLPERSMERLVLDPARWEPMERRGAFGPDVAARALTALLRRLDGRGDGPFLVAVVDAEEIGVRLRSGARGQAAQMLVLPLEVER
ncbi:MAG TPA: hypothetical protein VNN19_09040 [bacterium]|nr:hypothetical protein [bacterium]